MGSSDSKLSHSPSFDQVKSMKISTDGRKKNIPINSFNKLSQAENTISVSNEKPPHFVETTILIWLDISSEKQNDTTQKTLKQFYHVTNIIQIFSDLEKCFQFINSIQHTKILFVVSGSFGPLILPRIENFNQIYSIYIFCGNKSNHIEWTKSYKKIKGIHTQIKELCDALRYDNNQYDKSLTPISILPPTPLIELNESNKEFVYLQVMKSILLEIEYDKKVRRELIVYSRQFYSDAEQQLNIIDTFEETYELHSPIWWYTRKCFTYRMLRQAFCDQDFELIYKLAFFIRALHRDIKKSYLHTHNHQYHTINVYRAATVTYKEFETIENNLQGLLSFNDFVITTLERAIALRLATKLRKDPTTIAVIYKLDVNPTKSSIPFIALNNLAYLSRTNGEILLSMNTIFHIDLIEKISDRLYEITLSPSSKNDDQIKDLVNYMQKITSGRTGWYKLSKIMMEANEYDKAKSIYKYIYDQTHDNHREERAFLLHELGYLYDLKNDLPSSISHYHQAVGIYSNHSSANNPNLLATYNNFGCVLQKRGELSRALEQYQNALKLAKSDDLNIIIQYNNIGIILQQQRKYFEAQQTFEKAVQILLNDFPSADSMLADTYHNMAGLFYSISDYSKAVNYYEKILDIEKISLPINHSSLASTYFNIATACEGLKDYTKAIQYAKKSVEEARLAFGDEHLETKENLDYLEQLQQKY